jgi:phage terminase small subunit
LLKVGPTGDPVLDFSALTRDQAAALVEVVVEDFVNGRGEDARDVRRVKFKLADKKGALADMGRHLGMFIDRRERSGDDGGSTALTRAELDRQAQQKIIDTFGPLIEHQPHAHEEPGE